MLLPPEKQQEVLMQLLDRNNNSQQNVGNNQQFAEGGTAEQVPVEAERNETLTTQDGSIPNTEGGYLERKSFNPISGQATYEIPDNEHNQTHPEGGVNMVLKEGDVVNSDKTKIPTDFKVYGKNFKGKTFKEASDFLSKKEEGIQKQLTELQKEGKADRVSENSVSIMLAKTAINRNELNELQEQVLESKKQKEHNESLEGNIKQFGGLVKNATKAEEVYNKTLDRFLNGYTTERPVLKAEKGLSASISKMQSFTDKIAANPNMSTQDVMAAFKQSGLGNAPSFNHNSKTPVSFDYKPKNVTIPKQEIFSSIHSASSKYGVDPTLMFTMADIESSFNPNATSKTGAAGLFQFTKGTGKQYGLEGEKRYDLKANADAGARLLLDNQKILIKNGIEPTPVYTYLAHQLGAGGAIQLYNNITKGTPIPASTMSNMGLNFGKKSAEQYLAETTKKVMSRYDGYATKLQEKDSDLSLDAHQIKQQYQLPYQPKEIKSDLYNFGIKGITERLKANTYKPTTSTTQQQPSQFREGGKIYAKGGVTLPNLGFDAINEFENTKGNSLGQSMNMGDNYAQSQATDIFKFITDNIGEDTWNKMPDHLKTQVYSYAFNHGQKPDVWKGLATAINPDEVYQNQQDLDVARQNLDPAKAIQIIKGADFTNPNIYNNYIDQILPQQYQSIADNYNEGFDKGQAIYNATWKNRATDIAKIYTDKTYEQNNPFSTWQGDKFTKSPAGYNTVPVNKADYSADNLLTVAKRLSPYSPISSNTQLQELIRDNYKKLTGKDITKIPFSTSNKDLIDGKFGDDWKDAISYFLKDQPDLSATDPAMENFTVYPDNRNDLNKNKNKLRVPPTEDEEDEESTTASTPGQNNQNKEASWLDKLKYGMRESYLDNLRLMREGRIMPTLQQRPYDNPYDNMRTDYNIQSNLNENQRALLTTIADSTGNPSVRNARLAQLAANAANMNNQLYSQKYNQELAMENQKTLGQGNYRNQFNLDNMNLQKRYEQEVLQTIENQRQQKHMASNKMMNDYLRKQESDQARDLSLLETNYDWNPYTGKPEFNPEKAKQNMAYKKATFSSSSNKNSDIITIGGNKYIKKKNGNLECLDCDDKSQTTKYGGKIKRK